jgi:hypothetical protein
LQHYALCGKATKTSVMTIEPAHDVVQRYRLEALALVAELERMQVSGAIDRADAGFKERLERLREISGELRRIAAKGTMADTRREAATLATLLDDARQQFDRP